MYGEKASKAILSNLSYQLFGKVNDPNTTKYHERYFEIVKKDTTSINRGYNLNFDTRVTTGERETPKIRAEIFFKLSQGEFVTHLDGEDRKVQFKLQSIDKFLPQLEKMYSEKDFQENFERVYRDLWSLFSN